MVGIAVRHACWKDRSFQQASLTAIPTMFVVVPAWYVDALQPSPAPWARPPTIRVQFREARAGLSLPTELCLRHGAGACLCGGARDSLVSTFCQSLPWGNAAVQLLVELQDGRDILVCDVLVPSQHQARRRLLHNHGLFDRCVPQLRPLWASHLAKTTKTQFLVARGRLPHEENCVCGVHCCMNCVLRVYALCVACCVPCEPCVPCVLCGVLCALAGVCVCVCVLRAGRFSCKRCDVATQAYLG